MPLDKGYPTASSIGDEVRKGASQYLSKESRVKHKKNKPTKASKTANDGVGHTQQPAKKGDRPKIGTPEYMAWMRSRIGKKKGKK